MIAEPGRPAVGAAERDLARRFADALAADDIDGVVALLTDDAWLAMPPSPASTTDEQPWPPSCGPAPRGADTVSTGSSPPGPTAGRPSAATSPTPTGRQRNRRGSSSSPPTAPGSALSRPSWTLG